LVVAIEKEDELEHIVLHLTKKVITLHRSRKARWRTKEERRALREEGYDDYFRAAQERVFDLSNVTSPSEEGTIVGLFGNERGSDDEEILGLGLLREIDYEREKAVVFTPVDTETGDAAAIKRIKTGGVKLITVNGRLKEFKSAHHLLSKP
jgi:polynucleotide 5'-kinase involved in rRNA processing